MEKAIEYFMQIAGNRETINSFTTALDNQIENGEIDNLEFMALSNALIKKLSELNKKAMEKAFDEADKYGNSFEYKGFKFTAKEAGVRFDFSECNYPQLIRLSKEIKEKQSDLKDYENFVKSLSKPKDMIDDETGEIVTVYPPIKKSTTILEVR